MLRPIKVETAENMRATPKHAPSWTASCRHAGSPQPQARPTTTLHSSPLPTRRDHLARTPRTSRRRALRSKASLRCRPIAGIEGAISEGNATLAMTTPRSTPFAVRWKPPTPSPLRQGSPDEGTWGAKDLASSCGMIPFAGTRNLGPGGPFAPRAPERLPAPPEIFCLFANTAARYSCNSALRGFTFSPSRLSNLQSSRSKKSAASSICRRSSKASGATFPPGANNLRAQMRQASS